MRGFSKAIITGNLTRDPELRTTSTGSNVCGFSVAVNRVYKDANGDQREDVSYIDCSAWGRLGEMINQYARKGTGVLVSGRLDQHSWEDKTTGQKRSRVEIIVEDFNFVGAPPREGGNSGSYDGSYNSSNFGAASAADTANVTSVVTAEPTGNTAADAVADPEGEVDLSDIPF